jgi:hypothetical protein
MGGTRIVHLHASFGADGTIDQTKSRILVAASQLFNQLKSIRQTA